MLMPAPQPSAGPRDPSASRWGRRAQRLQAHLAAASPAGGAGLGDGGAAPRASLHPFGVDDMFRERRVGAPQLSPCGQRVAYLVTTTDRAADESETALWVEQLRPAGPGPDSPEAGTVTGSAAAPVRMTAKGHPSASSPRWSPDGSLLTFLSARADPTAPSEAPRSTQVWAFRLAGGDAVKLTALEGGCDSYEWSPDRERPRLLLSKREDLTPPKPPEGAAKEGAPTKAEPWVMDSLEFKQDYVGYLDVNRGAVHLYVQEPAVPEDGAAVPTLTQITSGVCDEHSAVWNPDGRLVAFSSNRTAEPASNTTSNIYVVSADNTDKGGTLVKVTAAEGAGDEQPSWSKDGKWIAYVTRPNADADKISGSGFATPHLAVAPADGSGTASAQVLTTALDRNVSAPTWLGDRIVFQMEDSGRVELASICPDGSGLTRILQGDYCVGAVHLSPQDPDVGVAVLSYPLQPGEIFVVDGLGGGGGLRQLTHLNDAWLSELKLGTVEKISFHCEDTREYTHSGHQPIKRDTVNDEVEYFMHKPLGFQGDIGMKYPTLLWIHGGPVSQWDWSFLCEQHLFAGAGFVVLSVNPRGSTGRGQEFCQALFADWGGPGLKDVLGAVDHAVAQGGCDPDRLVVGGWSCKRNVKTVHLNFHCAVTVLYPFNSRMLTGHVHADRVVHADGGILTNQIIVSDHRFKAAMTGASALDYRAGYGHDQYQMLYEQELGLP